MLKIVTTPTSISISDSDRNILRVIKGVNGIEYHSTQNTAKGIDAIFDLQNHIKTVVLTSTKDNYKVRFDKLAKHITTIPAETFKGLKRKLVTI